MSATVYIARDGRGRVLYVGCTTDLHRRLIDHKSNSKWYGRATQIVGEDFPTLAEAREVERRTIQRFAPPFNVHHAGHHRKRRTNARQQIATLVLGQSVHDWIAQRRADGAGWRTIAVDLASATNGQVVVSHESVRQWAAATEVEAVFGVTLETEGAA